ENGGASATSGAVDLLRPDSKKHPRTTIPCALSDHFAFRAVESPTQPPHDCLLKSTQALSGVEDRAPGSVCRLASAVEDELGVELHDPLKEPADGGGSQ